MILVKFQLTKIRFIYLICYFAKKIYPNDLTHTSIMYRFLNYRIVCVSGIQDLGKDQIDFTFLPNN